jgi:hypothetical protein
MNEEKTQVYQLICSAYQPPASSTFLSEQTSHQQSASSTFLSEQSALAISHQPNEQAVSWWLAESHKIKNNSSFRIIPT